MKTFENRLCAYAYRMSPIAWLLLMLCAAVVLEVNFYFIIKTAIVAKDLFATALARTGLAAIVALAVFQVILAGVAG